MKRFLCLILLVILSSNMVGCIVPGFSGDPARRTQQNLYVSENLRLLLDEWERFWLLDQPSHLTPYRTHGGLI